MLHRTVLCQIVQVDVSSQLRYVKYKHIQRILCSRVISARLPFRRNEVNNHTTHHTYIHKRHATFPCTHRHEGVLIGLLPWRGDDVLDSPHKVLRMARFPMLRTYPVSLPMLLEGGGFTLPPTLKTHCIPVSELQIVRPSANRISHDSTPSHSQSP